MTPLANRDLSSLVSPMQRALCIHIDPDFDPHDAVDHEYASMLRAEAGHCGIALWHFVGCDVPALLAREHHLERLFYRSSLADHPGSKPTHPPAYSPARIWLKMQTKRALDPFRAVVKKRGWHLPVSYPVALEPDNLLQNTRLGNEIIFGEIAGMIIRRAIAHTGKDSYVTVILSTAHPTIVPVLTSLLFGEQTASLNFTLHVRLLFPASRFDGKLLKSVALILEMADPDRRIKIQAKNAADADPFRRIFGERVIPDGKQSGEHGMASVFETRPVRSEKRDMESRRIPVNVGSSSGAVTGDPAIGAGVLADLRAFKNIHRGQRCFIAGNGPSLNKMDLNELEGEYIFCSNAIFLLFDRVRWRPQYYACVDTRVLPDRAPEIIRMHETNPGMVCFFPRELTNHQTGQVIQTRTLIPDGHNRHFFAQKPLLRQWQPWIDELPFSAFSIDPGDHLVQPYTVSITLLQLAVYMGFDPIYLIGCDTDYKVPRSVMQEGDETKQGKMFFTSTVDDDPNHFTPEYFGKGRKWHNPQTENMIWHYRMAHEAAAIQGTRIFNATVGGKLEVFPRVDVNGLFP